MNRRKWLNNWMAILVLVLAVASPAAGQIIYVDPCATGANDGTSWGDAYNYLQDALAVAGDGNDIWVAEGTYTPDSYSADPNGSSDPTATFQLINGVAIYGGFPSGGGVWEDRDPNAYETILSGDYGDVIESGPGGGSPGENCSEAGPINDGETLFDTTGSTTDGSGGCPANQDIWYVYTAEWTGYLRVSLCGSHYDTYLAVYEGTTCPPTNLLACNDDYCDYQSQVSLDVTQGTDYLIRVGGYGSDTGTGTITIGRVRAENSYHVVTGSGTDAIAILEGFTITGGYANGDSPPDNRGGGMLNMSSSPTVSNCVFISNRAYGGAGGMYNNNSSPTLSYCDFNDNAAQFAGAMMNCQNSSPTLTNCTFSNNEALYALGTGSPYGGGMYNVQSSPTLSNCTFQGNSSEENGGGMFNYDTSLTLTNCIFSGNTADYDGGAINNLDSSNITISNCIFTGNSAVGNDGGGMNNDNSGPTISNCIFTGNSAYDWGGGMRNINYSSPTVTNCTFSGNTATSGGGMYNYEYSSPTVTNCIFWDDTPDEIFNSYYSSPTVTYSDFQGGWSGTGNMNEDPCFVDANGLDDIFGTEDDDLQLLSGSPCVDKGDNSALPADTTDLDGDGNTAEPIPFDLAGNTRIVDGNNNGNPVVDMGAYEMVGNSTPVACIVGGDRTVEAGSSCEVRVTLDGSCSSDADSTPRTNDDINDFDWFEQIDPCDPNSDIFLGTGEIIECNLPLGEHDIILEVIDKIGAFDSNEVTITVEDTTPPEFTNAPEDMTVECDGAGNSDELSSWLAIAAAEDLCGEVTITHDFAGLSDGCGATGSAIVTWTATDESGNKSSTSATFAIVDTASPVIELIGEATVTVECHSGTYMESGAVALDDCDSGPIEVIIGGDVVDVNTSGTYVVTYNAVDDCGNDANQVTRAVEVVDNTPPVITVGAMVEIWPPNHEYRQFKLSDLVVSVEDDCGGLLDVDEVGTIISIYSDEPEDATGNGDGATTEDIVILGASSFKVRAEREGRGNGRVYGVTLEVVDGAGNKSTNTCYVGVPHDNSGDAPVNDGVAAGYMVYP